MTPAQHSVTCHGTTLAMGPVAAMVTGPPGAGKSDIALRCLALPPSGLGSRAMVLVSDDQTRITAENGILTVRPPRTIQGKLEVRGVGLIDVPFEAAARLALIVELISTEIPRLPPEHWSTRSILDVAVPVMPLRPFEPSAPLKLMLALQAQLCATTTSD